MGPDPGTEAPHGAGEPAKASLKPEDLRRHELALVGSQTVQPKTRVTFQLCIRHHLNRKYWKCVSSEFAEVLFGYGMRKSYVLHRIPSHCGTSHNFVMAFLFI